MKPVYYRGSSWRRTLGGWRWKRVVSWIEFASSLQISHDQEVQTSRPCFCKCNAADPKLANLTSTSAQRGQQYHLHQSAEWMSWQTMPPAKNRGQNDIKNGAKMPVDVKIRTSSAALSSIDSTQGKWKILEGGWLVTKPAETSDRKRVL